MPAPSPAFIIDLAVVRSNCEILSAIKHESGCRIVHALKAFALPQVFPLLRDHLDGCCASGLWEARLAHEFFGGHVLTCGPAYSESDLALLDISSHLDFNSLGQWERWRERVVAHPRFQSGELRCGLRINPRCSTGPTPLYDPCAPGSRLGTPPEALASADLTGLSGLHFHTLCEQGSDALETTLAAVEQHFGEILRRDQFTWLNMGGGHWITQPGYDRARLVRLIKETRQRYRLDDIWLEPGEAAVLHAGTLSGTVLDLFPNGDTQLAILDVSATAHMPDILEMPYRPAVTLDGEPATESGPHLYRLGGNSSSQATSSAILPSIAPWSSAMSSNSRTWRNTPWSNPPSSTASLTPRSSCATWTAPSKRCASSATRTSRSGLDEPSRGEIGEPWLYLGGPLTVRSDPTAPLLLQPRPDEERRLIVLRVDGSAKALRWEVLPAELKALVLPP